VIAADDLWSAWLARERSGGDAARAAAILAETRASGERVLRRLPPEIKTIADVGCGEGLVGVAALERFDAEVVFCDVSAPLIERARAAVTEAGALARARFVLADAASLAPLPDESVDAVVTRASLAYVADKRAAFAAAFRVLRPGGTLSIAEPVFRDASFRLAAMRRALGGPAVDPDIALLHRWHAMAFPDTVEGIAAHPLTNFDERNLLALATGAGFIGVHVRLHLDPTPFIPMRWENALATALLPGTPTLGAALAQHYTAEERERFERRFRPLFERGGFSDDMRITAYLWATRPQTPLSTPSRASISA
jgi:SAM-dependent methyltransferase